MRRGGRCLLDALSITSKFLACMRQGLARRGSAPETATDLSLIEDVERRIGEGHPIYRVRFFVDRIGPIDRHPWTYCATVDLAAGAVISCRVSSTL